MHQKSLISLPFLFQLACYQSLSKFSTLLSELIYQLEKLHRSYTILDKIPRFLPHGGLFMIMIQ